MLHISGNSRSVLVKKNIAGSILIKGWNCIVQLVLVPLTLMCLNKYEYGIWLTINSILLWIDQFDIGLGNGLRNRLAASLAKDEKEKARVQVSTTFGMLILIVIPILVVAFFLIENFNMYRLLNVEPVMAPHLKELLAASVALVGATFIFKFIGNVYLGLQLPAINNLIVVMGQTMALAGIGLLALMKCHSLMAVTIVYTAAPLLIYLLSYPITFTKYKHLTPSLKLFDKRELRGLFELGIKFFFVQVAGLVIFASSNLLISRLLSPAEVSPYQVSFRYFSLTTMLFTIIAAPLWTATTDAYVKNDWQWIKHAMKRMKLVMFVFLLLLVVMLGVSSFIYKIWIGNKLTINFGLSALMALYMQVLIYSTCYSNILFGIGKIRLITIVTVLEALIYIPLALFLGGKYGTYGIVMALILVNIVCAVCNRVQYAKLVSGKAAGIWNK